MGSCVASPRLRRLRRAVTVVSMTSGDDRRGAKRRSPDIEVARLLVRRGFVHERVAIEVLKAQKTRAQAGEARLPFLRALLEVKAISARQLPEIKAAIRRHTYVCGECNARVVLVSSSAESGGRCPHCGAEIAVDAPDQQVSVGAREETAPELSPAEASDAETPPQTLIAGGRYEIHEEIGRGALGVVYKARDRVLNRDLALKILVMNEEPNSAEVTRFKREAAAVQKLRHDGIAAVFDFGAERDLCYLSMELVDGAVTLESRWRDPSAPDPVETRLRQLVELARSLEYAHGKGVVHRDLNPKCVLLDRQGQTKLVDFSLAKDEHVEDEESVTRADDRLGSPLFMAPEHIRNGASRIDARADVWSLGVLIFVALTGRYPFRGRTVIDIYEAVLDAEPDWTGSQSTGTALPFVPPRGLEGTEVPSDLRAIIQRALAKSPDARYQAAAHVADDLERHLRKEPLPESAQAGSPTPTRPGRPGRLLIGAAGLMAVSSLLLLGWWQSRPTFDQARCDEVRLAVEAAWAPVPQALGSREVIAQVVAELDQVEVKYPDEACLPRARRALARFYAFDDEAARADLAEARRLDTTESSCSGLAQCERARVALALGDGEAALEDARRAVDEADDSDAQPAILLGRAALLVRSQDALDEAERALAPRLDRNPDAEALAVAARVALERNDALSARARATLARARSPQSPEAAAALGLALLALGETDEAVRAMADARSGFERAASDAQSFLKLEREVRRGKASDVAAAAASHAAGLAPWSPVPLFWQADVLSRDLADVDGAVAALGRALAVDPLFDEAGELRTLLALARRDPATLERTESALLTEAQRRPGRTTQDARPWVDLAQVRLMRRRLDEAQAALSEAKARLGSGPAPGPAHQLRARVQLFEIELARLRALPWIDDFVAWIAAEEDANVQRRPLVELARVRLALGEPGLARDVLDDCMRRGKRTPQARQSSPFARFPSPWSTAYALRATARAALGDHEGALMDLEKGLDEEFVRYVVPELAPQVLNMTPEFQPLAGNPRFEACLAAAGKHPSERQARRATTAGAQDGGDGE